MAAGFAALGASATVHTLGYAMRNADAARALAFNRTDARLKAVRALALAQPAGARPSPADMIEARDLARSALRRDPTVVAAVDALALLSIVNGDARQGRALFRYATQLSRRDLPSQVWSIEDAVQRDDVRGALMHYDIALRSTTAAPGLLFPILSSAITDPVIRTALIDRMKSRPSWAEAFLSQLADKGPDFVAAAVLLRDLQRHGIVIPQYARASLVGRLVERGNYDEAWRYFASATPGISPRMSRDPAFDGMPDDPTAFDWTPLNEAGLSASLQRGDAGGMLVFSAAPTVGGPLVRQLLVLPAGPYLLSGRSAEIDQPRDSWPYWSLTCADGREIGRIDVPASVANGGRFAGTFRVPAECPAQWLTFNARPSNSFQGLHGTLHDARLRPLPPS